MSALSSEGSQWFTVCILLTANVAACSSSSSENPKACTLLGCQDLFTASVSADVGVLPSGENTVTVEADGAIFSCTFSLSGQNSSDGGISAVQCQDGANLGVLVMSATTCMTGASDGAMGRACKPIPGKLTEYITIRGTPHSVRVKQSAAGTLLFEDTTTPTYQAQQPNGPGCGPICQYGGVTVTLP